MSSTARYLKQNVAIEPLYNQWYAWWYLISPATAPLFVANLHVKIMQSFVAAPDIHVAALKNPALMGGPYINYGVERVGEVKALLERTLKEQADDAPLRRRRWRSWTRCWPPPRPASRWRTLYPQVPDILRGYVELTYDLTTARRRASSSRCSTAAPTTRSPARACPCA